MKQTLVIVRGAPASGKTAICSNLRDTDNKIAWVSVDGVKPIFSNFDDRDVDISYKTTLALIRYLFDEGYSVVFDCIAANPKHLEDLNQLIQLAQDKNIRVKIYQLECSLDILLERHMKREYVKSRDLQTESETVERIYNKIQANPLSDALKLDTEKSSLEECLEIIRENFQL
jgi:chloramphenicol 3-O-phosphotransferase